MNIFLINIALALAWTLLTGVFSYSNLILGLILGYIAILVTKPLHGSSEYLWKIPNVITFAGFFLWELIKANIKSSLRSTDTNSQYAAWCRIV